MSEDVPDSKRAKTSTSSPTEFLERPRIVQLNVGGVHHQVSESLLSNIEPCMLSTLVSNRWQGQHTLDSEGRIFIEGNGIVFHDVLDFIRRGPSVLKYMSDRDMHKLRIEADFYGLLSLQHAIDDIMLEKEGHGNPVVLSANGWARNRGQVREAGRFSSWGWLDTSGNRSIIDTDPERAYVQYRIGESGTYLMFVRLLTSPHFRLQQNQGYPSDHQDEFAAVHVERRATAEHPASGFDIPVARFGVWDYRTREETNNSPSLATFTCAETLQLLEGDLISISFPAMRGPRRFRYPVPDDLPPDLFNSFTLVKVQGDSVARFERKRVLEHADNYERRDSIRAAWIKAGLTMPKSPLEVRLSDKDTVIEPQAGGNYLVLGRVAVKRDRSRRTGSLWDDHSAGHVPQFRTMLPCGRIIHTNHTVFPGYSDKWDEENLSENGAFQDIVSIEQGCSMELITDGETALENHGTTNDPFGKIPSQSLSMLLLSPSMDFDRYNTVIEDYSELTWKRALPALAPQRPALFDVGGRDLVYEGETTITVIVLGWFPPLESPVGMILTHNNEPVAYSQTLKNSGHCHVFHEILELEEGDYISVQELAHLEDAATWAAALDARNDAISFETGMLGGHLSILVLA